MVYAGKKYWENVKKQKQKVQLGAMQMRCDAIAEYAYMIRSGNYDNGCDNDRQQEKNLRAMKERKSEETNMKKETAHSWGRDPAGCD